MSLRTAGRLAARCSRLHGCGPAQLAALLDAPTSHSKSPLQPLWAALPRRFNDYDAAQAQAWGSRGLHVSSPACAVEEVLVPSMGDSISEGTMVNLTKKSGDSVAEDETIAQIETDKVTIDVKAPRAGTLTEVLVKDGDNVEVGQVVAKIDLEGGGAVNTLADKPQAAEQPKQQQQQQQQPKEDAKASPAPKIGGKPAETARPQPGGKQDARAQADPDKPHRVRLSFPPRRTADGRRISDMPVAEAARVLAELTGDSGTQSQGTSEPAGASTEVERASEMEGVRLRRWAVGQPLPMDEDWQPAPGKWALSERELEMINLGGAEP